ncbi:MAG: heme ABC transporter ATP-binding protein [Pedobacter sp.]|nr:MAG: heme ABC transporter ATP-binding protein [Pedobacter sp.]
MLVAENLTYKAGQKILVQDISFHVNAGELLVILGANGAGKSTLFHMLSGDKKPASGKVTLNGKAMSAYTLSQLALQRGVVNQQNIMNMAFTVVEIVLMGRYPHYNTSTAEKDQEVAEKVMDLTGVSALASRSYLSLSGGEQQRVQLARVLAQIWDIDNALLLMDEPVSNLDIQYQQQTLAIARKLAERGFIVVAILHDINLAAQYADRIIMLKSGKKCYDGPSTEVLCAENINYVFDIHADTFTNPTTNRNFFIPKDVTVNFG